MLCSIYNVFDYFLIVKFMLFLVSLSLHCDTCDCNYNDFEFCVRGNK
ncbi:hypothetical protein GLYMA_19G020550v4 [Glycine max]|nr:hypothetical protein GLYMA_19G020550v4 [Glycine max]KAH1076040.1 hypothetical protein GYH30_051775 [Glycine max]